MDSRYFCNLCLSGLPIFSSKSFIVSGFIFRSLIHFEFIFCIGLENVLISCGYPVFSASHTEETIFSPFLYSCHFCVDHRGVGLFLGFLLCSVDP